MTAFTALQVLLLVSIALAGTAVVLTRNPKRQVFIAGVFGLLEATLFYDLHSPDVALSELAVGTIALPILVLATLGKLQRMR
jgi:energy-converting hydrogenase B subunit D